VINGILNVNLSEVFAFYPGRSFTYVIYLKALGILQILSLWHISHRFVIVHSKTLNTFDAKTKAARKRAAFVLGV
jgi:hypothetical protein